MKLNQREHDLVRQMRQQLLLEDLITLEEYTALATEHGGVQRLEDYDLLRAKLIALEGERDELRKQLEAFNEKKSSIWSLPPC